MNRKYTTGNMGENIASGYLIKKGWQILARNYRRKSDEIDIIAKSDNNVLVFCEVKTITKTSYSDGLLPEDNLTSAKFKKISRTCQFFARQHPSLINEEKGWRIDLIAIDMDINGKELAIRHYENI